MRLRKTIYPTVVNKLTAADMNVGWNEGRKWGGWNVWCGMFDGLGDDKKKKTFPISELICFVGGTI